MTQIIKNLYSLARKISWYKLVIGAFAILFIILSSTPRKSVPGEEGNEPLELSNVSTTEVEIKILEKIDLTVFTPVPGEDNLSPIEIFNNVEVDREEEALPIKEINRAYDLLQEDFSFLRFIESEKQRLRLLTEQRRILAEIAKRKMSNFERLISNLKEISDSPNCSNKVACTSYSFTDSKYPDNGGGVHGDGAAYRKEGLVPIYNNTSLENVNGEEKHVHSCAAYVSYWEDGKQKELLPQGSILYVKELDEYFRVDDNKGIYSSSQTARMMKYDAWGKGCSIWIDIYVGRAAFESKAHGYVLDYGNGVNANGNPNTPASSNIVWADGAYHFSAEELNRIKTFYNKYYSSKSFSYEIVRWGRG